MNTFQGFGGLLRSVPGTVAARLGRIDRAAGKSDLYRQQLPGLIDILRDRAKVESVEASSAIEGVIAARGRAEAVIRNPEEVPRNRNEEELRGYSNALTWLIEARPTLDLGAVLHLHKLLYEPTGMVGAGQFKTQDNVVIDRESGVRRVRFRPVPAARTPQATKDLIDMFLETSKRDEHHPLIVVGAFLLDFTVIHPVADGNGRVSRLLMNLLLDHAGYDVGRYVSVERQIERTKDRYYEALLASTHGWHDGRQDPWPWLQYFTETVEAVYTTFVTFAEAERGRGAKKERVRNYLERHARASFSMEDLRTALPGVSDATMRKVLQDLRKQGLATSTTGRKARWTWKGAEGPTPAAPMDPKM